MKRIRYFLATAAILLLTSSCEECAFCSGEASIYLNGDLVETEEIPALRYCDELLEELQQNPSDTFIQVLPNQDIWMRVTVTECN